MFSRKRKHEESSDSKRKIKKAKHSFDKNTTAKNNIDDNTDKQSSSSNTGIQKHKNTKNVNKASDNHPIHSISKTKTKQKKHKNRHKKPSRDKSIVTKFNDFWGKLAGSRNQLNPTFSAKKSSEMENTCQTLANGTNGSVDGSVDEHQKGTQALAVTNKVRESNRCLLSNGKSDNNETSDRIQNGEFCHFVIT